MAQKIGKGQERKGIVAEYSTWEDNQQGGVEKHLKKTTSYESFRTEETLREYNIYHYLLVITTT